MNVLSLFSGYGGESICLEAAGIEVNKVYASEINKDCIKVHSENYPDVIHLGDVEKWMEWDVDWSSIDFIVAGSPCQGFSNAGKQEGLEDSRSKLFFVFIDILNHVKSLNKDVAFLLENVKMKEEFLNKITGYIGVDGFFIDSKSCSPCARPRWYWSNMPIECVYDSDISFLDCCDINSEENVMSDGWHLWWEKNKEFQLKKSYSAINKPGDKGITMTTRQYASWNGNFIETPSGRIRKPTKTELSRLVGAKDNYFESVSQRKAEEMTGNGWDLRTVTHIFKCMFS